MKMKTPIITEAEKELVLSGTQDRLTQAEALIADMIAYLDHFHVGLDRANCTGCRLKAKLKAFVDQVGRSVTT